MFLLSVLLIAITGGISFLISWLYILRIAFIKTKLNSHCKTVLVLGKQLKNDKPDIDFTLRLKRAAFMLSNRTSNLIYILGGETRNSNISEASAGKKFLVEKGIDQQSILLEEKSQNTLENLKHFYTISKMKSEKISLITNRYHLARSLIMAKGFGIRAQPCPAENKFTPSIKNLFKTLLEAFHIHWYLTGKYWAKLTHNKRILNRIS